MIIFYIRTKLILIAALSVFTISEATAQSTTVTPPAEAAVGTWQCVRGSQRLQGTQYMKGSFTNPPVVKWQATIDTGHGGCEGEPVIGDVNGDGKNDVIINTADGNLFAFDGATGTQLWVAPMVASLTSAVIGDANGDGRPDVAIASDKLYLLDGATGNIIWAFAPPVPPTTGYIQTCPNEADLDGDGNVEVVIIVDDAVYAVNGKDGTQKWVYTTGHPVAGMFNGSTPAIGDVNGDGYPDVVASLENGTEYGQLVALDGRTGSLIWGRAVYGYYELASSVPALGDVTGDCKLDVVYNGAALNGATGAVIWGDPTSSYNYTWGIIADLKGDCNVEVVTESSVLNGKNGSIIWADTVDNIFGWFAPAPKVGDFNPSSPGKEIVVGASYQMYDSSGVQVVEANPVPIKMLNGYTGAVLWTYDLATLLNHTVEGFSLGDIDNDGCVEIVIAPDCCNGDPTLLALDDDGNASECGILASISQVNFVQDTVSSCNCYNFQDFSSACANSWNWSFPGGTPSSSTAQNPGIICYPNSGSYSATMTASVNTCPADTVVHVISGPPPAAAQFQSSDTILCANDCINFTDLSTNNPTSWLWSFQGGMPSISTIASPQGICYSDSGIYNVTLIVSNCAGADTLSQANFIQVAPAPPAPDITQSYDTLFCSFDSSYISYQWYSDTGLIAGATRSFLVISTGGNYNVKVTSNNGCFTATGIYVILGIEKFTIYDLQFTISPNPVQKELIINSAYALEESGIEIVDIYNMLGEKIYNLQSKIVNRKSEIQVDVSNLSSGIYFIRISNDDARWNGKFIKL